MNDLDNAKAFAKVWIEHWNEGDPDSIPLSENFIIQVLLEKSQVSKNISTR